MPRKFKFNFPHPKPSAKKRSSVTIEDVASPIEKGGGFIAYGIKFFDCGMGEITECRWNPVRESLTSWYFWLNNLIRSACIVFKAGKNCNGYFTCDDLIEQVDKAIDIFEERTNRFATGLFIFGNAPSHQK